MLKYFLLRESRKLCHKRLFPHKSCVMLHQTSDFLVWTERCLLVWQHLELDSVRSMEQYDMCPLTTNLSLYHGPSDLTAFGAAEFESDQLHREGQSWRMMFSHSGCRREEDCSSLDLKWFELQRIMSLQVSVFYIKLDWPIRLPAWFTFQDKFSKDYY